MVQDRKEDTVYYEIAEDNLKNRNIIIPQGRLKDYIGRPQKVCYGSMYGFANTILDHMTIYKTVSSFKDTCFIKKLVFDIDCHDGKNYEKGLKEGVVRVRELISQLAEFTGVSEYAIPIWFSGRGFHLETEDFFHFKPSNYLREEVLATMKHYFPFIDHKPYMTTGLIRLPWTYNDKVGYYKVPLHLSELDSIEGILEKAKYPRDEEGRLKKVEWEDWDAYDLSSKIIVAEKKANYEIKKHSVTRIVTCVQKMFQEGPQSGARHDNLLRMLTSWRRQGQTYGQSLILAKHWINGQWSDYEVENQVNSVWKNGYFPYSCTDHVMAKYCDPDCIFYKGKSYNIQIADNMTIEQDLKERLMSIDDPLNPVFDMNNLFDLGVECQFRQGNMIVLFGHPKIGKTFLVQYLTHNSGKRTLYYTLEMPSDEVLLRQYMIASKESEDIVTQRLLVGEELYKKTDYLTLIDQSPTLTDIQSHIEQFSPDWVVIDTIDQVSEDQYKSNETMRLTYLFQKLKQMAIQYKVVIIIVQHIPSTDAYDKDGKLKPLTMFSGLYSKEGARKADKVIGWEGYHDSNIRRLRSLALRRGKPFDKFIEYSEETSTLTPRKD